MSQEAHTIVVVGPAESGKSSFARLLSDALRQDGFIADRPPKSWPVVDTSDVLILWLAEIYAAGDWPNGNQYRDVAAWSDYIRRNKPRYREQLVRLAQNIRAIDAHYLSICALEKSACTHTIVVGLRDWRELCFASHTLIYVENLNAPKIDDGLYHLHFRKEAHFVVSLDGGSQWTEKAAWLAAQLRKAGVA